jgi:hypothetical protein
MRIIGGLLAPSQAERPLQQRAGHDLRARGGLENAFENQQNSPIILALNIDYRGIQSAACAAAPSTQRSKTPPRRLSFSSVGVT